MKRVRILMSVQAVLWTAAACGGSKAESRTTPEGQPAEEGVGPESRGDAAESEADEDFPDFISDEVKNQAQTLYKIALDLKKEENQASHAGRLAGCSGRRFFNCNFYAIVQEDQADNARS